MSPIILVLVLAFCQAFSKECSGCTTAINSLMFGTTFDLPNITLSEGVFHAKLSDMSCFNISVSKLDVEGRKAVVDGLEIHCAAYYEGTTFNDKLLFAISDSSLDVSMTGERNEDGFYTTASVSHCTSALVISQLRFSNHGFVSGLLSMIKGLIGPALSGPNGKICAKVAEAVSHNVTEKLEGVYELAGQFVHVPNGPDEPSAVTEGAFRMSTFSSQLGIAGGLFGAPSRHGDLMVNNLIRFGLNSSEGLFRASNNDSVIQKMASRLPDSIQIPDIVVSGLDSITDVHFPHPANITGYPGEYSLAFDISLKSLEIGAGLNIILPPESLLNPRNTSKPLSGSVAVGVSRLRLSGVVQIALPKSYLSTLKMNRVTEFGPKCILAGLEILEFTMVDLSISSINGPVFSGFDNMAALGNEAAVIFHEIYDEVIPGVVHGAVSAILPTKINEVLQKMLSDPASLCPEASTVEDSPALLSELLPVKLVNQAFSLIGVDSPIDFDINWIIDLLTKSPNGVLSRQGPLKSISNEKANATISNALLRNFDTLYLLDLLKTYSPFVLSNSIGLGGPGLDSAFSAMIGISSNITGAFLNGDPSRRNDFSIGFGFSNATGLMDLAMNISTLRMGDLTLAQMLDQASLCSMSTIDSVAISEFALGLSRAELFVSCSHCDTPGLLSWEDMLSHPEASSDLTSDLNDFFRLLTDPSIVRGLNAKISSVVANSSQVCQAGQHASVQPRAVDEYDNSTGEELHRLFPYLLFGCGIIALTGGAILLRRYVHGQVLVMNYFSAIGQNPESQSQLKLRTPGVSLSMSATTPRWAKIIVPLLLISQPVFMLLAASGGGSQVWATASVAGDAVNALLTEMSMGDTVQKMFKAHVYLLAIFVSITCLIWPMFKMVALSLAWFASPMRLRRSSRSAILKYSELLGKWSLSNCVLTVVIMSAFRFNIVTPERSYLPEEFFNIETYFLPAMGMIFFLSVMIVQLVLSHIMRYYESEEESILYEQYSSIDSEPNLATSNGFDSGLNEKLLHDSLNDQDLGIVSFSLFGKGLVTILLLSTAVLIGLAADSIMFEFNFEGVIGKFMGERSHVEYSMLSTGHALITGSQPNTVPVWFLYCLFMLFAIICPIAHIAALLVLWLAPLRMTTQKHLMRFVTALRGWCALDVFVVSVVVVLYQLGPYLAVSIGEKCSALNELLVYIPARVLAEPVCFGVQAQLNSNNCWLLLLAGALSAVVSHWICVLCERITYHREAECQGSKSISNGEIPVDFTMLRVAFFCKLGVLSKQ